MPISSESGAMLPELANSGRAQARGDETAAETKPEMLVFRGEERWKLFRRVGGTAGGVKLHRKHGLQ